MERIELAVVIPVGPNAKIRYVKDTLESILHYTTTSRKIIVLDDSRKNIGRKLKRLFPEIIVLKTSEHRVMKAGLFLTLCQGIKFACKNYIFNVLLKMDTDALIIGANPEGDAIRCFRRHPEFGSIGSYQPDCNGELRDFSHHGKRLIEEISDRHFWKHPERRAGIIFLRKLFQKSMNHGYEPGEHCQGGAYFISGKCVVKLHKNKLLSCHEIHWSRLEEDVIFGLFMCAMGLKLGDLATGLKPMGIRWRGLPCSPRQLLARRKKITHSTRFYKNLSEDEIRAFFRKRRQ